MKNKILFAIFTCNRFFYFKNCIESILQCNDMDRIDILICDNKTIEKGFDEYVNKLCNKHSNIVMQKFEDRDKNELYRAMGWAVKYAKKLKYDIIHFLQDDYQYLFKNNKHLDDVVDIFSNNSKLVQLNCNLAWKRKSKKFGKTKTISSDGTNYAIALEKSPCDNGFTRVGIYDKIGDYPADAISWGLGPDRYKKKINGEIWFGRKCNKLGYKRALSLFPNIGMIFDCAYVRGDDRYGDYFKAPNKFYLKLLSSEFRKKIYKNNRKKRFSYIEDFCIPDGWVPKSIGKHGSDKIVNKIS